MVMIVPGDGQTKLPSLKSNQTEANDLDRHIHRSFILHLYSCTVYKIVSHGVVELNPGVTVWEAEYTLDKSQTNNVTHLRFTLWDDLESPLNKTCLRTFGGREPEGNRRMMKTTMTDVCPVGVNHPSRTDCGVPKKVDHLTPRISPYQSFHLVMNEQSPAVPIDKSRTHTAVHDTIFSCSLLQTNYIQYIETTCEHVETPVGPLNVSTIYKRHQFGNTTLHRFAIWPSKSI